MNRRLTAAFVGLTALLALAPAAASAAPSLSFAELTRAQATVHASDERVGYTVRLKNSGDAVTTGTTSVAVVLPSGAKLGWGGGESGWTCYPSASTCTSSATVAAGANFSALAIDVWLEPGVAPPVVSANFFAFGGGSSGQASAQDVVTLAPAKPFEVVDFAAAACTQPPVAPNPSFCSQGFGSADFVQAGGHPYGADGAVSLSTKTTPQKEGGNQFSGIAPIEEPRNLVFELPAGFIGNLQAVPEVCTFAEVQAQVCDESAAVGGVDPETSSGDFTKPSPIFRIIPEDGFVAAFAFAPVIDSQVTYALRVKLRANGDYGVTAASPLPPQAPVLLGVKRTTLCSFGAKAPTATQFIGCRANGEPGANPVPFLTNPTRCGGAPPVTALRVDSYHKPGPLNDEGFPDLAHPNWKSASATAPQNEGCEAITEGWTGAHEPTFTFQPDSDRAAASAAFTADLHIPKAGLEEPEGLANSHLKDTKVILPEGISLNPSAADGLGACSLAQAGYQGNEFPAPNRIRFKTTAPGCPGNSKIATVQVTTPVLANTLPGAMYLAAQKANPFGSDFAVYLVVDDPKTGIKATIPGKVTPDPETGRIETLFAENPQAPIEDVQVSFFEGPRASLSNPDVCGDYQVGTEMTPWSAADPYSPQADEIATPGDQVGIATAPAGQSSCATSKAARPFAPSFTAGSRGIGAGQHAPFTLRMTRSDGEQEFDGVTVNTPPGFTAALRGVATCPEASVQAAIGRDQSGQGADEIASPSCPPSSQVGTTTIGAGSGPSPVYVKTGKVYLAGPYKSAPLSLAFIVPAVAGPFDLGVQVVRTALHVDPTSAQIKAQADPIPQILRGVPVQIRDIRVDIDREDFTLNPTNCEAMAISASLSGGSGASAELGNRFQVGECEALGFKPRTSLQLFGGIHRAKYQGVRAIVRPRPGDANIAGATVRFPSSAFVAQEHLNNICTRVQWAADACPKSSVYGTAEAISPLLDEPLRGNLHLRSSNNLLPDLVADLRGPANQPIRVEVAVKNDSVKGALRNTVTTAPDAPVTLFRMQVFGGEKGLIVNSRNICKDRNAARVSMRAHNGRSSTQVVPVRNARCAKWRKAQKRKAAKRKRMIAKRSAAARARRG